jgi:DNA polymerase I
MATTKRPLFCLIDASSFIFRAFYAVRPLSNKAGLPTNAVFGFANMILKVLEEMRPTHIAVVYDTKHPSFRKEMYGEYKANRSAMPEDLVPQIPYIKKFIECLGLPAFERPGFEADDIIATLAERAAHLSSDHAEVCIVSSDKDLMQLVNKDIYLYDTMKDQKFTPEEVKGKLGVYPALVADYLGIVGDTSDNIPGVKGIGPKGALSLLEQFGSLEGVYGNLSAVKKDGQRKQLEESKELALLSKKLATVIRDMPLELDWHKLRCEPRPGEELFSLLQELEFRAFETRMRSWVMPAGDKAPSVISVEASAGSEPAEALVAPPAALLPSSDLVAARKKEYGLISSAAELKKVLAAIPAGNRIAIDTETTGLRIREDELVGFSFCGDGAHAYYVPLAHSAAPGGFPAAGQMPKAEAMKILGEFLVGRKVSGQNLKFDLNILRRAGVSLTADQIGFDTMIASYVLEPEARHGLDLLTSKHLGHKNITFEELCGEGKKQITFAQVPLEEAKDYAAEDAHVAYLLAELLQEKLTACPELDKVFREIDLPLVTVLADLEWEGVAIDTEHLRKVSADFSLELARLEKRAHELAGGEFNLSSPKQLQKILFEDLKLPTSKKTKTGFSTDVEVLEKLSHLHELPRVILENRELSKLQGTYVDVLPTLISPESGRVHAQFNQTVAATGRLSSSEPNLQNIPIRTKSGKLVRQAFIAEPGHVLLGADYSQVELRVLASMSGDELLTRAFNEGQDVHALTASQIYSVPLKEVNEDQRRKAKAINFGLVYGKSAFTLAEELGISRAEASDIIQRYFAQYPTIRGFLDSLKEDAKKTGYSETLFGRRRAIEGIHSKNKMILAMGERMAVNTPIQGTAADLVKIAMVRLSRALAAEKLKARMILQVHDELVLEVPESEVDRVKLLVKKNMEGAGEGKIRVPLTVDIGVAKNWLAL